MTQDTAAQTPHQRAHGTGYTESLKYLVQQRRGSQRRGPLHVRRVDKQAHQPDQPRHTSHVKEGRGQVPRHATAAQDTATNACATLTSRYATADGLAVLQQLHRDVNLTWRVHQPIHRLKVTSQAENHHRARVTPKRLAYLREAFRARRSGEAKHQRRGRYRRSCQRVLHNGSLPQVQCPPTT